GSGRTVCALFPAFLQSPPAGFNALLPAPHHRPRALLPLSLRSGPDCGGGDPRFPCLKTGQIPSSSVSSCSPSFLEDSAFVSAPVVGACNRRSRTEKSST